MSAQLSAATPQPPLRFDRASGVLEGANAWEQLAALALAAGSKISSHFSHRGYNGCANLLRKTLPERDIAIKLNPDAVFEFPYGAVEPSSQNFAKLANNAKINGGRFEAMKCAIGATRGTARLSGTKHEAFSIAGDAADGEEVPVIALDNLLDDGKISADGKYLIKLDVEGVEIEAIKGGTRLLQGDSAILCEEHGNDPTHSVSRYILEQTPLKLIVYDPRSDRFETVTELSILDRIKVSTHVGYNVLGTASAFWENRVHSLNASATRRAS